jgi:hypothetical protein
MTRKRDLICGVAVQVASKLSRLKEVPDELA